MSEKQMLLRRLSSAQFAAWETRMFLDTHPDNRAAAEVLNKYTKQADELREEYEKKYGPIVSSSIFSNTSDAWVKGPWPWEVDA